MSPRRFFKTGSLIALVILLLYTTHLSAQNSERDSVFTKVRWIHNLPKSVQKGWLNSGYASWLIFGIKKIETHGQTLYSIHVAQMQSLGPDDADIGSEYELYLSDSGQLLKKQRID